MKITSVRATAVEVPVTRVAAYSKRMITHVAVTVVEVETDAGISGLGEARGTFCARIINERFAPAVVGLPVADHRAVRDACLPAEPFDYGYPELLSDRNAFAGIEIALWGHCRPGRGSTALPTAGRPRRGSGAPFVAYAYTVDPAEGRSDAEVARIMSGIAARAGRGGRCPDVRVQGRPPLAFLRGRGGKGGARGGRLRGRSRGRRQHGVLDGSRPAVSSPVPRNCPLANIEEPVAGLGMIRTAAQRLRGAGVHPLHRSRCALAPIPASTRWSPIRLCSEGSGRWWSSSPKVRAIDKRVWLRARWELGIAWAVMCHLGVARPELDRPSQALIDWIEDDLVLGEDVAGSGRGRFGRPSFRVSASSWTVTRSPATRPDRLSACLERTRHHACPP